MTPTENDGSAVIPQWNPMDARVAERIGSGWRSVGDSDSAPSEINSTLREQSDV